RNGLGGERVTFESRHPRPTCVSALLTPDDALVDLAPGSPAPRRDPVGDRSCVLAPRESFVDPRVERRVVDAGCAVFRSVRAEDDDRLADPLAAISRELCAGGAHE